MNSYLVSYLQVTAENVILGLMQLSGTEDNSQLYFLAQCISTLDYNAWYGK